MTTPRGLTALPPLSAGAHKCVEQGACVMEAVAYVAGEPWTDRPACACPVLGAFMRAWNDDLPTDADRDRLLRPLIPRLAGSRATPEVETCRAWLAVDWLVRTCAPTWLALTKDLEGHAHALRGLPALVSADVVQEHHSTITAAWDAARAAAASPAARDAAARVAAASTAAASTAASTAAASTAAAWDAAAAAGATTRAAAGATARAAAEAAARAAAGAAARAAAGAAAEAAAVNAAWAAARAAAGDAARAAAVNAAVNAARAAIGDAARAAAVNAAWAAIGDAARAALQPTVATLQRSALDLVDRMLAETASE